MDAIRRCWPPAGAVELDDDDLAGCYDVSDRLKPRVRVNFVSSVDGAATQNGVSGGLSHGTGGSDKRVFDLLRQLCDVVLVGAGTVRIEGYGPMRVDPVSVLRRAERGLSPHPVFAIVSGSLDLDPASPVFTDAPVRPILVTTERAPEAQRARFAPVADVVVCAGAVLDADAMLAEFSQRGLNQVLCEGGPTLFGSLLAADRVDELCLTISPLLEAGDARRIVDGVLSGPRQLTLEQVLVSGSSLLLRYLQAA